MKSFKSRKDVPTFKKKCDDFENNAETRLFDISACKCVNFENCTYNKDKKVPQFKQVFLSDQRTLRKIDGDRYFDGVVSKKNFRRAVIKESRSRTAIKSCIFFDRSTRNDFYRVQY